MTAEQRMKGMLDCYVGYTAKENQSEEYYKGYGEEYERQQRDDYESEAFGNTGRAPCAKESVQ